jgi:hypothetical protein
MVATAHASLATSPIMGAHCSHIASRKSEFESQANADEPPSTRNIAKNAKALALQYAARGTRIAYTVANVARHLKVKHGAAIGCIAKNSQTLPLSSKDSKTLRFKIGNNWH